ncbi:MAG: hypothetical protein LUG90_21415 [Clostridiaceae bacterium]|nr:hypothetical protein [Clostridiaceae bacterium]
MDQLIIGETDRGTYYVRPMSWAGIWDKNGRLSGCNVLYESKSESDCKAYVNRQKLLELVADNPELPVIPMVSYDCVADGFGYWLSRFGKVEIEEIYVHDEKVYIRSKNDWDSILEEILTFDETENMSDKEAKEKVDSLAWKKGIVVYIEADVG